MIDQEKQWKDFVMQYEIEVPRDAIANEMEYIRLNLKHNMQYDALTGGGVHLFPDMELENMKEEIYEAAVFEAKSDLVLKDVIQKQEILVSPEELEQEALALVEKEKTSMDMVKRYFGEDLALLEGDVKRKKAIAWACASMQR